LPTSFLGRQHGEAAGPVAETAAGQNDQTAIAQLRRDGQDNLLLTFYRVDELSGTINGLHPGDPGYQAAVRGRTFHFSSGAAPCR
jgi:hypothetical protein